MKFISLIVFSSIRILSAQEAPNSTAPKAALTQWEYTVSANVALDQEKDHLTKLGAEGWELVSVIHVDSRVRGGAHLRYYLKRQKSK